MGQKRSIHAFIDKQTGDLYKPAGVNAPAKVLEVMLLIRTL